ncbi:MAG: MFS transporter [Thermoleophilia bacterium]|nr:MFS transporter [Thermoleophilia bacterium]
METAADPRRWKALAVLGVAYLMVVLDVSIVNVALPSIQTDLGFTPENLQWVVSGYALTFGGFLLLGGRMGDLLGRRRLFMVGLGLFFLTSLWAGLASSETMLIVARFAQGAAGAILSPSVFSIITVTFAEGAERNKALGILGGIAGSGAAIGVLLGGVLTSYVGWEWIFFVNLPIAGAALLLVPRYVRESRADGLAKHFDAWGAVTVTVSLMLLVYGLTQSTNNGWTSWKTIGSLVVSALVMAVFLAIELRSHSPLVRLGIFRRRTLSGANVIGFLLGTMIFGIFFMLTLYMQQVLGFSAMQTGVGYLAVALTAVVSAGLSQALVTRFSVKPVLTAGMLLLGGGLLYFTQVSPGGSYVADLLPGFILTGIGMGFSFVPISIAALAGVEGPEAGLASGLINTSQQIGGALGLAILATVATTRTENLTPAGRPPTAEALTSGFSLAFWFAAGFSVVALLTTLAVLRRQDLARVDAEEVQPVPAAV